MAIPTPEKCSTPTLLISYEFLKSKWNKKTSCEATSDESSENYAYEHFTKQVLSNVQENKSQKFGKLNDRLFLTKIEQRLLASHVGLWQKDKSMCSRSWSVIMLGTVEYNAGNFVLWYYDTCNVSCTNAKGEKKQKIKQNDRRQTSLWFPSSIFFLQF